MGMMFRLKKSIPLGYVRQGYIYFSCLYYKEMTQAQQLRIDDLCREAAGDNWQALLEFLTSGKGAEIICDKHHIGSKTTLYEAVHRFYMKFPKRI
jgi:hypothetical protein